MRIYQCVVGALLVSGCFMLGPNRAFAQGCSIVWNGPNSGFWQSRFNWSPMRVPSSFDNVCIGGADVILTDVTSAHTINSLTTGGSLTISGSGVFLRVATTASIGGNLTVQNGQLELNGPTTVSGSVTIRQGFLTGPGPTNISGGMILDGLVDLFHQTINHQGVATMMTPQTRLRMWGGAVFNNLAGATFNAVDGLGFDVGDSGSAFNNHGTFVKEAASPLGSITAFGGVRFNNTGTLDVRRGSLRFHAGFTQSDGTTRLDATTLEMTTQPLAISGGILAGTGTLSGNVILEGTGQIAPGGPAQAGAINITGNYAQTGGSLIAEIGGTAPAQIDRLLISGSATLGGSLIVSQIDGFSPSPGMSFPVVAFASRTGTFAFVTAAGMTAQVNDKNVTMIVGSTCGYQVTLDRQSLPATGGAAIATITTGAGCPWTATDFDDWIDIVPNSGSGSSTIAVAVGPNAGAQRVALVSIAGSSFSINQAAAACEITLSIGSQSFSAEEQTGAFSVSTRSDCDWTAESTAPWIQITSTPSGRGEGQVQFHVDGNPPPSALRSGTIDVSGATFAIEQAAPTLTCTPSSVSVVLDAYQPTNVLLWSRKPWRIAYGQLGLVFSVTDQGTHCRADSNVGALPVLITNPLIPIVDFRIANSVASATLRVYPPDTVSVPSECRFSRLPFVGTNNNCLLNAPGAGAYYAQWTTTGFDTDILGTERCEPCRTGPYTFWVNLSALGLVPESVSFTQILRGAETFIHQTMIENLVSIDPLAFVQDPGNVNLVVIDRLGRTTGKLRDSRTTNDIPHSLYLHDDFYPAVVLFGPPSIAPFQVQLSGRQSGDFELGIDSTRTPIDDPVGRFSGSIGMGQVLGFDVAVNPAGIHRSSTALVVEGDLNADGLVTCADAAIVRAAFGRRTGQPGFNAWVDKVFPGVIDIRDLAYVTQRLPSGTVCQ